MKKSTVLVIGAVFFACLGTAAFAISGIATIATNVTGNISAVAKLITAGAYVAGMGFAVGAIAKFKAHKDNPTQVTIGQPIALTFVGAALLFAPSVFLSSGKTLFGGSGQIGGVSGITSFGGSTSAQS